MVYSNVQLNGVVLKAKQDTGAQINVMSMTVFKDKERSEVTTISQVLCQAHWLWKQSHRILGYNQDRVHPQWDKCQCCILCYQCTG